MLLVLNREQRALAHHQFFQNNFTKNFGEKKPFFQTKKKQQKTMAERPFLSFFPPTIFSNFFSNLENTSPLRVLISVVCTIHVGFILFSLPAK